MLRMHFILGSFCYIFRGNFVLYVIIYTLFLVLRLDMVLYEFRIFLDLFALALTPIECVLTSHECP